MKAFQIIAIKLMVVFLYSLIYYKYRDQFNGMTKESKYLDSLYFACTTHSTAGYGEITPKTDFIKKIVISQQILLIFEFSLTFIEVLNKKKD